MFIEQIVLANKDGSEVRLKPARLLIVVGPNGSGKTRLLSAIHGRLLSDRADLRRAPLRDIVAREPSVESVRAFLAKFAVTDVAATGNQRVRIRAVQSSHHEFAKETGIELGLIHETVRGALQPLLGNRTSYLTYENRLEALKPVAINVLNAVQGSATDLPSLLLANDRMRQELQKVVRDSVGFHLYVNVAKPNECGLVFSTEAMPGDLDETAMRQRVAEFLARCLPAGSMSHGVRAFVSALASMLHPGAELFLIDEPELALSAHLQTVVGRQLTRLVKARDGQGIVATHSSGFLRGCVAESPELTILRMSGRGDSPRIDVLDVEQVRQMIRDPLMRTSGVLSAIFHEHAVVVEAPSDAAFYDEINRRLSEAGRPHLQDVVFLPVYGKAAAWKVVSALRKLGVKTSCILDIDALKEGGKSWTNLLGGIGVSEPAQVAMQAARGRIGAAWEALANAPTPVDPKRRGGIEAFSQDVREACWELLKSVGNYGCFIVPSGELEAWFPAATAVSRSKSEYVPQIFEWMGSDPGSETYVKPPLRNDRFYDVWGFFNTLVAWHGASSVDGATGVLGAAQ